MDQLRLLLAVVLSALVFLLWQLFFVGRQADQEPRRKSGPAPAKQEQPTSGVPHAEEQKSKPEEGAPFDATGDAQPEKIARLITVSTPLYRVQISENGAVFSSFVLQKYRESVEKESPLKELLPPELPGGGLQVGLARKSLPGLDGAVFSTDFKGEILEIKDRPQKLSFFWKSDQDIVVEKTFTFAPETYLIGMEVSLKNGSNQSIQDQLVLSLLGAKPENSRAYGFEGPSALIGNNLEQIKIKKIEDQNTYSGQVKWIALQDRYFMTSIIPEKIEEASLRLLLKPDNLVEAQYVPPEMVIQPGTQSKYAYVLFWGPKSMKLLNQLGHDLGKAINFGMFDFIAKPCVWIMNFLYGIIPNYGVAIIILTLLVKILLWPLGTKSYKSMNEMKKLQPLMSEIREKNKNDKKRMNEEVMALYRTYKINPLGGCLPMIVQIPVFFALYRMLYEAIELRHAPFFLWIKDLSAPDRLFRFDFAIPFMQPPYGIPVLTIIMGGTMLLQQKMSPPMGDPTQAKMMMLMPLIFTVIFINFSSGLVLYWLVNNILSISHQYYISKKLA
ncbi:MAG: membrane protein insertase YidC [Desulfobacterales bacterium]|nr:MAG: membrane protein insertase YidC [Desulfobacterales bacterium]